MAEHSIYKDIAERTGGDIYIGVVGPVRSGKSTFITRFMQEMVLPNIADEAARARARDEMPQSAAGKTVMTTEPKFVPEQAISLSLDGGIALKVKMIDCVGYLIPEAMGAIENGQPRMVRTPWREEPMPFAEAAEIGTRKVIAEHSTIGIVVTTDGGAPLDQNLYQCVKGLTAAEATCNPGGTIILCAEMADGLGGEQFYRDMH